MNPAPLAARCSVDENYVRVKHRGDGKARARRAKAAGHGESQQLSGLVADPVTRSGTVGGTPRR